MNDKIKQLWQQASDITAAFPSGNNSWEVQVNFIDQLSKLVALECIDKLETYRIPVGNSSAGELACEWTYDAIKEIRDDIRETFGLSDGRG